MQTLGKPAQKRGGEMGGVADYVGQFFRVWFYEGCMATVMCVPQSDIHSNVLEKVFCRIWLF